MGEEKFVIDIYNKISGEKIKYGQYHKTLFHLHTPASHDYTLLSGWKHEDYLSAGENTLIELCLKRNIVPYRELLENVALDEKSITYSSKTEWMSYILLANELIINDYEMVIVSDHNTIAGICKLNAAIKEVHDIKKMHAYPVIVYGVEITCADVLHVVGIFEENAIQRVQEWLDENLIDETAGTFKTSLEVMSFFKDTLSGIAYIAHINSARLFREGKYLSGAYKKKLIDAGCFEYVGVHKKEHIEHVSELLENNGITTKGYVIDNDAHNIDDIKNNYLWIKSGKRSYKTLKEAFDDFDVSVALAKENKLRKYIKGVLIEKGGFLCGKDGKEFILLLSDSLNCFIGGRGTGKSTLLQVIDYALGIRVTDESTLELVCGHGNIWILFADGEKEYMIKMSTPIKQKPDDNVLRGFGQNEADLYNYKYRFDEDEIREYVRKHFLSVYEIQNDKSGEQHAKAVNKIGTLSKLYDMRYSVNELVQTASGNQIDDFIRQLMFQNRQLSSPENTIKCKSKRGLSKAILLMSELLDKRKNEVEEVIIPFNKKMDGVLRIVYSQNEPIEDPYYDKWIFGDVKVDKRREFKEFEITQESAIEYVYYVSGKAGIIALLKMALKEENRYLYDISDFLKVDSATEEYKRSVIDGIFDELVTSRNYSQIIQYLRESVGNSEKLSLEFNINSRTTARQGAVYKNVGHLSLGQKVVAMLDFVLGYGDFIDDNRPILIDQPEDNLDSQYIYMNLVHQLRDIKDKRQVIIATHNATIVTNAMADQVCVMLSDGKNGWIDKAGYPSEDSIKKEIINYLEGGKDSFRHKMKVYEPVLS